MTDFKPNLRQKYVGDLNSDNQRHGHGSQHWNKTVIQKYHGKFLYNNLHDEGVYTYIRDNQKFMYEGSFYANQFEGYSRATLGNCTYFEGLFKANKRFGPGILTYQNGSQDVGIWDGLNLIRLSRVILPQWIPTLGKTSLGKCKLLRYRKMVKICDEIKPNKIALLAEALGTNENELGDALYNKDISNPKSGFFNRKAYDLAYYGEENCEIDVAMNEDDILEMQANALSEKEEEDILGDFLQKQLLINDIMESLFKNISRFQQCSADEMWLINLKRDFVTMLANTTNKPTTSVPSKKLKVTELMTWNNEELCIDILRHTFLNRKRENILSFNIKNLLIGDRNSFGETGPYECICMAFLNACSEGQSMAIHEFCNQYNLNPDLSDSKGNTGIMYAAARDRIGVIRTLTQIGAKLDIVNDEGLTPLNMSILRYIAQYKDVTNWESAFLPIENCSEDGTSIWHERKSLLNLISHSILASIKHERSLFYQHDNTLISYDVDVLYDQDNVAPLCEKLGLIKTNNPNFQEAYNTDETKPEKYIFDTSHVIVNNKKEKISKDEKREKSKKTKASNVSRSDDIWEEVEKKQDKLNVIRNTIFTLLHYGADIDVSEVPMPSVSLSIFTENSKLVRKLITSGGNPNMRNIEGLTPLHVLVSLPASPNLAKLCNSLIELGADPNLRTAPDHWAHLKDEIVGKCDRQVENEGKTPLHIIGIRKDFTLDTEGHLNNVAKILLSNNASVEEFYLGHNVLTLAMLTGNDRLVKTLLEAGVDPNSKLPELGSPVALYVLKRFAKRIPPKAMAIYDNLFEHFGNPLNIIQTFGNAIEFMRNDEYVPPPENWIQSKPRLSKKIEGRKVEMYEYPETNEKPEKDEKPEKGEKHEKGGKKQREKVEKPEKVEKREKSKKTGEKASKKAEKSKEPEMGEKPEKAKKTEKKVEKAKKGEKVTKASNRKSKSEKTKKSKTVTQEDLKGYLMELARKAGFRHYQCKALFAIMNAVMAENSNSMQIFKDIAKFLTPADTERIFQILVDAEVLSVVDEFQFILMTNIMNYVIDNGLQIESKQKQPEIKSKDLVENLKPKSHKKSVNMKKIKTYELDAVEDIYIFCFNCGMRTDKILLSCPKCGLVYFCSEQCNKESIKTVSIHPCKILFYNKERERYDECMRNGVPYVSQKDAYRNAMDSVKHLRRKSRKSSNNLEMVADLLKQIIARDENFENPFANKSNSKMDKKQTTFLKSDTGEKDSKKDKGSRGGKGSKGSRDRSRGKKSGKGSRSRSEGKKGRKGSKGRGRAKNKSRSTKKSRSGSRKGARSGSRKKTKSGSRKGSQRGGRKGARSGSRKGTRSGSRKGTRSGSRKGTRSGSRKGARSGSRKGARSGSKKSARAGSRGEKGGKSASTSRYGTDKYGREKTFSLTRGERGYDTAALDKLAALESHEGTEVGAGDKDNMKMLALGGTMPEKYRRLLERLAEVFPDFDMSALFLPFVCFVDGQWYYRFTDDHPVYCPTYSSV